VLALVGVQAGLTIVLLTRVVEQSARLVSPALDRIDDLAHVEADVLRLRTLEYSLIWSTSDGVRQQYGLEMAALRVDIDRRLQAYQALDPDPKLAEMLASIVQSYRDYLNSQQAVATALQRGDQSEALWAYLRYQPSFQHLDDQLHGLRHQEYASTELLRDQMVQSVVWARWPLGIVVVLVAGAEVVLGWHVSRRIAQSMEVLLQGARRIAMEEFTEPVVPPPEPELATLAHTLNAVMAELAAHDAERARLEEERLRLARERLSQVVQAQEEERARISRELHDQAAQSLTALRYGLSRVQRLARDEATVAEVDRLITLATQTGRQISALARDLRPSVLDDLGLVPALRSYSREFSERIGVPVQFALSGPLPRLAPEAETAVFRVVQEALTNVAKHAQAGHAWVNLAAIGDQLQVEVRDDGRGFDPNTVTQVRSLNGSSGAGLGLNGIRERVQLLGGQVDLASENGGGTRIRVTFPLYGNRRVSSSPTQTEVAI
jgi:signal transduction histidine kinase